MEKIKDRIEALDWNRIQENMNEMGYSLSPNVLTKHECNSLITSYADSKIYRKTISMERYRFGKGEYRYFKYPLPDLIQEFRQNLYPQLSLLANDWMKALNIKISYPNSLEKLHELCNQYNQTKPTVLILKYDKGGYNTLHQDLYGEVFFPFQVVFFLNEPGNDFTGGEFVLIEQRPRAQSKAIVLKPEKGDMLIFTTNFRPVKGTKGYYRTNMKHGVSEVTSGNRHTLGIIFHDAL